MPSKNACTVPFRQRVLCIGNRYLYPDHAAIEIYHLAQSETWPSHVQWIEGGLGGLNLWPHFEDCERVWVLDYLPTLKNGDFRSLQDLLPLLDHTYDHQSAFQYCLQTLPQIVSPLPDIYIMSCRPEAKQWQTQLLQTLKNLLQSKKALDKVTI